MTTNDSLTDQIAATIENVLDTGSPYWRPRTKQQWRDFAGRVRALAGAESAPSRILTARWNLSWCDRIDIRIAMAPEVA